MFAFFRRAPLVAVALILVAAYIGMAEWNRGDDGPRTFVAALAAMALGAALYSIARGDEPGTGPPSAPDP